MKRRARAVKGAVGHSLRRVTALFTALALFLPTAAMAASSLSRPTVVTDADELPTVTVELNAVVATTAGNAADALTGELEVALRVKTGSITTGEGDEAVTKAQLFHSISAALEYSPLLTPIAFNGTPIDLTGTDGLASMTSMESLKKENRISTAGALVSANWKEETVGDVTQTVPNGGYLVLTAEAHSPVELKETNGNVLVVVSFKYDLTNASFNAADGGLPPVATDVDAVEKWLAETLKTPSENEDALIKFVPASVIDANRARVARELTYQSATNMMYYSDPAYDGVTMGAAGTADVGVLIPKLAKNLTFADAEDPADVSKMTVLGKNLLEISTKYDEIEAGKINFSLANKMTYDDSRRNNAVIIEFFDWDDTQIGALAVLAGQDAREAVNEYVKTHMIHPDLQDDTNYDSMVRLDNYRGKYPTTPMREEEGKTGPNVVENGENYPLTNKLDYVFFKRPMEKYKGDALYPKPDESEIGEEKTYATKAEYQAALVEWYAAPWTQVADEEDDTKGGWDEVYPYTHGWAVIDPKTVHTDSSTWTTLGVGELSYTGANELGGYHNLDGEPAEITVSGQEFVLANFDFGAENNNQTPGSVYAVKAIYEPGGEPGGEPGSVGFDRNNPNFPVYQALLDSGYKYRLVSAPYYNKLNINTAENGGAYSADISYERSNNSLGVTYDSEGDIDQTGKIMGVARIRDPIIRMDTTTDLKWENDALENAITSNLTKKRSYTPIQLDNGDVISFSLTLSARYNRIDYYLTEKYGSNFVGGQARSDGNTGYNHVRNSKGVATRPIDGYDEFVLRNYNYKDVDSELEDAYYDVESIDYRNGSLGYVLYGTLNNILEKATLFANDSSYLEFYTYVSYGNLNDCNIRMPDGETPNFDNELDLQDYVVAAVRNVLNNHYRQEGYWNFEKDCVELNYHQLQLYIIRRYGDSPMADNGDIIPGRATADAIQIDWCNLHTNCAGDRTVPLESLADILNAALLVVTGDNPDALNGLKQINQLQGLRTGAAGFPFSADDDYKAFKDALVAAIDNLPHSTDSDKTAIRTMNWEQVQFLLDEGISAIPIEADYANKEYWWKNNGKKTFTTWGELLEVAQKVNAGTYDASWLDNDVLTELIPNGLKIQSGDTAPQELKANATGTATFTAATLRTAMVNAVTQLVGNYGNMATVKSSATAMEIQHVLLGNNYVADDVLLDNDQAPVVNYWWITGVTITDLKSLVTVVKQAIDSGSETVKAQLLEGITVDDMSGSPYWLRAADTGSKFATDAALRDALVAAVTVLAAKFDVTTATWDRANWSRLQYLLFDGNTTYNADPDPDGDYWWYNDGHKEIRSFSALLEAAWNDFGAAAADSVDSTALDWFDDLVSGDADESAALAIINGAPREGGTDHDGVLDLRINKNGDLFESISDFKTAVERAITKIRGIGFDGTTYTSVTWTQFQNVMFEDTVNFDFDPDPTEKKFWWRNGGSQATKPTSIDVDAVMSELSMKVSSVAFEYEDYGQDDVDALLSDYLELLHFRKSIEPEEYYTLADASSFQDKLTAAIGCAAEQENVGYFLTAEDEDHIHFTWAEFQCYLLNEGAGVVKPAEELDIPEYSWKPGTFDANDISGDLTMKLSSVAFEYEDYSQTDVDDVLDNYLDLLYFRKTLTADEYYTKDDKTTFQSILESAIGAAAESEDVGCFLTETDEDHIHFSWSEIQYYLLNSTLKTDESNSIPSYSWKPGSFSSTSPSSLDLFSVSSRSLRSATTLTSLGVDGEEEDEELTALREENEALKAENSDLKSENEDLKAQLEAALALLAAYQETEQTTTAAGLEADDDVFPATGESGDIYEIMEDTQLVEALDGEEETVVEESASAVPDTTVAGAEADNGENNDDPVDAVSGADPASPASTVQTNTADPPDDTGQTTDATSPESTDETTPEGDEPQMSTVEAENLTGTIWSKDVVRLLTLGELPDPGGGGSATIVARGSYRMEVAA